MKKSTLFSLFTLTCVVLGTAQNAPKTDNEHVTTINALIEKYTYSRETKDTSLLQSILTTDVDQLVSSGEWRIGVDMATKGMMQSSGSNPRERTITIDKIRFLNSESAIVDTRYEIRNTDGTKRKMWSTFIVVFENNTWKISAIRNMLPAK
ncbi:DUF4440 domain-containing protein [Maribellus comscasis]|uniref:DUF4440 domain-containing protein n=1 Tax=Maribellus comscasis TaxID=2681766 RepID=A0A6I6JLV0_9BACT|nr:DUF4440 domain-containing protein [Maribellus comscasis]QGY42189.1 DUF4440 domain-containing protein [Maribellus comscasis]